jgi:hypothetical protein
VGLVLGRANDEGIRQEVSHIDEGVGADTLVLAKVFKGIACMEGVDGDFEFLAITGGMHEAVWLAVDLGEFQLIHEVHDAIVGAVDILQCEIPVDRAFQFGLGDAGGNTRNLVDPDEAAITGNPGEERPVWRFARA